jgi:hypothetical protein
MFDWLLRVNNVPSILEAYADFVDESNLLGYTNTFKDKLEFVKMYFSGDYNYIND